MVLVAAVLGFLMPLLLVARGGRVVVVAAAPAGVGALVFVGLARALARVALVARRGDAVWAGPSGRDVNTFLLS